MAGLAQQGFHVFRTTTLHGTWLLAQSDRPRVWLLRLPAKLVRYTRGEDGRLPRGEPVWSPLLQSLRCIGQPRATPDLLPA